METGIMKAASNETIEENQEKIKQNISTPQTPVVRVPVKHGNLGIRSHAMDMSTMVELTSFSTLGKIQPFLVTISTSAALLVDLHSHLTDKEICGYLGGHWDINSYTLSILEAFPCRYSGKDKSAAALVEAEIAHAIERKKMIPVGWYHSHPRTHASPSLRDVDAQLDYEIKMKGPSDNGYIPCVGLICSPYNTDGNCYESNFNIFWSLPPPENRPHEYPRPMLLSYTLSQEHLFSPECLEDEIRKCVEYYKVKGGIDFKAKFNNNTTYLEKLRDSLQSKLPTRNRNNESYWDVIREIVCPGSEDAPSSSIMKFPLMPKHLVHSNNLNYSTGNVFLAPINLKPENSNAILSITKQFGSHNQQVKDTTTNLECNSIKNEILKQHSHLLQAADSIPSFRTGELTVSLKSSKNDYEYSANDFSKMLNTTNLDPGKSRTLDYTMADCLNQQITKFPDLSKLASFSAHEIAKLSGFPFGDLTKPSSSYMKNIANLFGPHAKSPELLEGNERRSSDHFSVEAISNSYRVPSSSPSSHEQSRNTTEDYASEKKRELKEKLDYNNSTSEDQSISNTDSDFSTLDMSTKKHHSNSRETLNLSKER